MIKRAVFLLLASLGFALVLLPGAAAAEPSRTPAAPERAPVTYTVALPERAPAPPSPPTRPRGPNLNVNIQGTNPDGSRPATSLIIMLGLTVLSVAPALLLLCTCFTKIFMVLGITRNALGLTSMPPNQVLAGLALFISLFIMGPTVSAMNEQGVQPYLKGDKTQAQAFKDGVQPLRDFMWKTTRDDEVALMIKLSGQERPANRNDVELTTLVPAFILSELRAAFIIGFVIFIPFLLIDMVVSASLMSLGMMMLPPVTVALPFKLLLFVIVNGWGLILTALVASYR
ncbi:flagellar type III secretion system pore protein FliP [Actinoplanes sp. LDG1-06]|uniref:Flagellar biosynthetic protein FliP n=1 Tax=Paractinoplanes ovalisporus TaxID=2810368 RepID=A0ABS2AC09_9ACTN|nr:flagellar type III secretion system pore protein FliP [Actinoplanes ovalisporus]MBM2617371.1 flagellar type III secretion system pore protein FliP [Actinoplanes ovalisporus]